MTALERSAGRSRRFVAAAAVAVAALAAPAAIGLHVVNGTFGLSSLATTGFLFALLGALVMVRQPSNRIGAVLATIGVASVLGALAEAVTMVTHGSGLIDVPGTVWAGWFGDWYWLVVIWLQFVAVPLLFPDGRPTGAKWRWFGLAATAIAGTCTLLAMGGQDIVLDGVQLGHGEGGAVVVLDNPLGVLPVGNFERDLSILLLFLPLFGFGAAGSLALRFRRSTGDVRRQLKVAVTGIVVAVVGFVAFAALDAARWPVVDVLELPMLLLIPVSLGVAVLRYRLYEIDRIVSRTVTYAVVTVLAAGVYLGVVVTAQAALRPLAGSSDLGVALATLAAAATFRPLLGRVRVVVDRRFNRSTYDAATAVERFGERLRDEVDVVAVRDDLHATAAEILQPASAGVWLTGEGRS